MGYSTSFEGRFSLDRPLTPEHAAYLHKFSRTRRMKRDAKVTEMRPDPIREAVGLPVGPEGAYFVGAANWAGQEDEILGPIQEKMHKSGMSWGEAHRASVKSIGIVDYNRGPEGQPGLWCQWIPTKDNTGIKWDGGEKFYDYEAWLRYIVENFLKPWGYVLNGEVKWQGEEDSDTGSLYAVQNYVGSNLSALHHLARAAID